MHPIELDVLRGHARFMTLNADRQGRRKVVPLPPAQAEPDRSHVEGFVPTASTTPDPTPEDAGPSSSSFADTTPTSTASSPTPPSPPPEGAPVAAKKKTRRRHAEDFKRQVVAEVEGAVDAGDPILPILERHGLDRTTVNSWRKDKKLRPPKGKVPVVGIAEEVPFAVRAEGITAGADLLGALDRYIDARVEQSVKRVVADVLKRGIG